MTSPIYCLARVVSWEVLDEERRILRAEGWFHVEGRYLSNAFDADTARRLVAERRVRERARSAA